MINNNINIIIILVVCLNRLRDFKNKPFSKTSHQNSILYRLLKIISLNIDLRDIGNKFLICKKPFIFK